MIWYGYSFLFGIKCTFQFYSLRFYTSSSSIHLTNKCQYFHIQRPYCMVLSATCDSFIIIFYCYIIFLLLNPSYLKSCNISFASQWFILSLQNTKIWIASNTSNLARYPLRKKEHAMDQHHAGRKTVTRVGRLPHEYWHNVFSTMK